MSLFRRLHLAFLVACFPLMLLAATVLGAVAFWDSWSGPRQAITVFLAVMFAMGVAAGVSIAFDRRPSVPWLRMGTVALFIVLGCGVAWVRDMF